MARRAVVGALIGMLVVFAFDLIRQPPVDTWLSLRWYLFAAAVGALIAGPIGSLRTSTDSETPIDQVTTMGGV
jgi:hypothetical protein